MLHDPKREIKHAAKQLLHNAAEYFEHHAWCQGVMQYRNAVCLFGGIREVQRCNNFAFSADAEAEAVQRIRQTIVKKFGSIDPHDGAIAGWNDMPGRTKQQVIDVLRTAADLP